MTRGRLQGYLRYQVTDFLSQKASIPLLLITILTGLTLYSVVHSAPADIWTTSRGMDTARQLYMQMVTLFLPLGAFLGSVQLMSQDRHLGHFRFFFSKPVNSVTYYAQQFVVHGLLYIALYGLITWIFGALTAHQSVRAALGAASLTWVLVAGVGFLYGALTRFDGTLLAVTYLTAMITQTITSAAQANTEPLPIWVRGLARGLPPIYKMDQLRNQLYSHQLIEMTDVWYVVGYGGGAFLIGLLLLRKLPLSR